MRYNVYFDLPAYCGGISRDCDLAETLALTKRVLTEGGEITTIVESEKDMGPV